MKRWAISFLLLIWAGFVGCGQASVFEEMDASVPWLVGRLGVTCIADPTGLRLGARWSLAPRLEVAVESDPELMFAPSLKLLVLWEAPPLSVSVRASVDRVSLLSSLFLGPVGADIGRCWGAGAARWGLVWFAPHPELTMGAGIRETSGHVSPTIAFRWRPPGLPGWGIAFEAGGEGPRLTIGGRR